MGDLLMDTQLTQDKDLWARIRRGFAMPDLQDNYVISQETWYANRPEYIGRMTERSRKYLYHIVEELERRKMPTELALLPFIESAFNPQADSSVKAAGMWQFMPATGKHFSLKQNAFNDDRRDVQASTRAALDYLQKLYGMFGDWHLALAAYNWGEGSVMRAMNRNQKAGLGTTYTDLSMPNETRNYVPKLQAVKNIVADPVRFAVDLPNIPNHPYFRAIPIDRDMDVAVAAQLAEVSLADFKALNPAAKKSMIVASGTPRILLPWDSADVFSRNLAKHQGRLATYTAWVVPKTMRLGEAADRSGMEEGTLRALNNIPKGMMVRGGSTLLVERAPAQAEAADISQAVAENARVDLAPEITMQKTYIRAGRGETVAHLADRYGVSASSLANWNGVSGGKRLKKGQMLVVMVATPFGQHPIAPSSREAFAEAKTSNCHGKGKKRTCANADEDKRERLATRSKKTRSTARDEGNKNDKDSAKVAKKKSAKNSLLAHDDAPKKGGKAKRSAKERKELAMADSKPSKKRRD
jgi:membrane-bound lytic murein transglycosylase D